jgi:hypothetical protein
VKFTFERIEVMYQSLSAFAQYKTGYNLATGFFHFGRCAAAHEFQIGQLGPLSLKIIFLVSKSNQAGSQIGFTRQGLLVTSHWCQNKMDTTSHSTGRLLYLD